MLLDGEAGGRPAAGTWQSSLDLELQAALEDEVRHTVAELEDRGARHAALVVLDNRSGEVLAWVGSPDFWSDTAGQVDMVVSPRQPGSALKPFLYAMAFDRGATAATVLADVATTYQTAAGPYHLTVDLERCEVRDDAGFLASFSMDAYRRASLLEGLDEIGLTLQLEPEIAAYERRRAALAARYAS